MNRSIIYIILSVAILLPASLYGQTVREGSESGNLILSAVERYNERDIDGALAILKEAVAEDPENDAAWYYIAQCGIVRNDIQTAEQGLRMACELDPDNFWYR